MSVGTNPFINSPFGHPNFNPTPVSVKISTRSNAANEGKSSKLNKPQDKQNASTNRYNRKKNQNEGNF